MTETQPAYAAVDPHNRRGMYLCNSWLFEVYCVFQSVITLGCLLSAAVTFINNPVVSFTEETVIAILAVVVAGFGFIWSTAAWIIHSYSCCKRHIPLLMVVFSSIAQLLFLNVGILVTFHWTNAYFLANACLSFAAVVCFIVGLAVALSLERQNSSILKADDGATCRYLRSPRGSVAIITMILDLAVIACSGAVLAINSLSTYKVYGVTSLCVAGTGFRCRFMFFLHDVKLESARLTNASQAASITSALSVIWIVAYAVMSSVLIRVAEHPAIIAASATGLSHRCKESSNTRVVLVSHRQNSVYSSDDTQHTEATASQHLESHRDNVNRSTPTTALQSEHAAAADPRRVLVLSPTEYTTKGFTSNFVDLNPLLTDKNFSDVSDKLKTADTRGDAAMSDAEGDAIYVNSQSDGRLRHLGHMRPRPPRRHLAGVFVANVTVHNSTDEGHVVLDKGLSAFYETDENNIYANVHVVGQHHAPAKLEDRRGKQES